MWKVEAIAATSERPLNAQPRSLWFIFIVGELSLHQRGWEDIS